MFEEYGKDAELVESMVDDLVQEITEITDRLADIFYSFRIFEKNNSSQLISTNLRYFIYIILNRFFWYNR